MAETKHKILALALACACALSLLALAACSQSAERSSSETFSAEPAEETQEAPEIDRNPFYVLVVGNDTRTGTTESKKAAYKDGSARSDTMMLVRVDPTNYQITMISIPRDTQDWVYDRVGKINESYEEGGIEELMGHIAELTGAQPKYYLDATFIQFQDLVNTLGGINVYVPIYQEMTDIVSGDYITLSPGEQTLDGAEALVFARERKAYNPYGEVYRQTNDRYIVQTIIQAVLANPTTALSVARQLYSTIDSNWPIDELSAYVQDFAEHAGEVTFMSGTGPYYGDTDPVSGMWLTTRDEGTWAELMATVNAGGDPNTVVESLSAL